VGIGTDAATPWWVCVESYVRVSPFPGSKMADPKKVVDGGIGVYPTVIAVNMPANGQDGVVHIPAKAIAAATGVDLGECVAAVSMDGIRIVATGFENKAHLVVTDGDGQPVGPHTAVAISDGGVEGVHAVILPGENVAQDTYIGLQPANYPDGATRAQMMKKAVSSATNWNTDRGKTAAEILSSSVTKQRDVTDQKGVTHSRVLVKTDSMLGKLFEMNKGSQHATMSLYNNPSMVDGKMVVALPHAETLAKTLSETLRPCHPLSASGMTLTVSPMKDANGELPQNAPYVGQIRAEIHRTDMLNVLASDDDGPSASATVTTGHLAEKHGVGENEAESDKAMFAVTAGGQAPVRNPAGPPAAPAGPEEAGKNKTE